MQASFNDLVGSVDFKASASTFHSVERGELARELSGLTPALDVTRATTRMAHEASEAIPTIGGQTICTNCAYDLAVEDETQEASGAGITYQFPVCISEEARDASSAAVATYGSWCFSIEAQDASGAGASMRYPMTCISEVARDASGASPTNRFPYCISDEAQEAGDASMTLVSACMCMH